MLSLLLLVLAAGAPPAVPPPDAPRNVVRAATLAVEGDSVPRVRARWTARVARDPRDRAALLGLASLARLAYDYPTAERAFRQLDAGTIDGYATYARLGFAEGLAERSFDRAAVPAFERARAAAHAIADRTAEADAVVRLAYLRGRVEGVKVALAFLDTAQRLAPDSALDVESRIRDRMAIARALQGRAADARAEAESSIALARRARDTRLEGDGYLALAKVLQFRGRWDSALVALKQSTVRFERARARSAVANASIWYAQVLGALGHYGEMREVMRRTIVDGEATNNPGAVGDAHRAFGVLATIMGDWPTAAEELDRAVSISVASGDSSTALTGRKYQALVALAAGDLARARQLTAARLAWAERADDAGEQLEAWRTLLAIGVRARDWSASERAMRAARDLLPRLPGENYRAWTAHDEARFALARGDLAAAQRWLGTYLGLVKGDPDNLVRFDARVRLADVHARRGDLAGAEREMTTAADDMDRWRTRMKDAAVRTLAFQGAATVEAASSEPGALESASARVLAALAGGGRTVAAFDLAERWRARELMGQLARAVALRTDAPAAAPTPNGEPLGAHPRRAADVVAALPADGRTALLEIVGGDGTPLTLFVVQRGGVRARVLPPVDSLGDRIARFDGLVESGADAARLGRALGAALVDPVLAMLDPGVTRLVVVPDGPLHRLPFDALRLADGRYVLERWAVSVAPSASVAATLWARGASDEARRPRDVRLLAYGDPNVRGSTTGVAPGVAVEAYRAAFDASGGLRRLEGAAREAQLVARYAPAADVRIGDDASAAFLKRTDLRRYRVLHFATHALVDERSVGRSALALAPGGGESGFVGPGDLASLRLDADLVVLSACRSAGGVVVGGEGVQGLTAPLLAAGARSLVATAWRIRDQGAVPFVDAFYAALARGLPVGDALRAAKLDAIRRGEPPRTWAAFVAIGDPLVTLPLRPPARPWWARLASRG